MLSLSVSKFSDKTTKAQNSLVSVSLQFLCHRFGNTKTAKGGYMMIEEDSNHYLLSRCSHCMLYLFDSDSQFCHQTSSIVTMQEV
jgi:hypothetical protein